MFFRGKRLEREGEEEIRMIREWSWCCYF